MSNRPFMELSMRYIFSFLCLLSVAVAAPSQPLALEQKIQKLEKELDEMRFQNHVKERVYGTRQKADLIPVDHSKEATPHSLKLPEDLEKEPAQTVTVNATPETPEPTLSEEHELYIQGRHYLAQQRLDLARKAFDEIVEKYDGTPESILARFWIGEFMLRDKNYPGASIALGQAYGALKKAQRQKGFSTDVFHGEADRLPEILAKLAYALKMINKRQDACITVRQLKKEYKKRPANLDWYIKNLSKELKCR